MERTGTTIVAATVGAAGPVGAGDAAIAARRATDREPVITGSAFDRARALADGTDSPSN